MIRLFLATTVLFVAVPAQAQLAYSEPQTFTPNVASRPSANALADFDEDGDLDVVASSHEGGGLTYYENTGGGVFADEIRLEVGAGVPNVMRPVDYDADGDLDLVVARVQVGWLENDGSGRFAVAHPLTESARLIRTHRVVDLDADGALDLLATEASGSVVWYRRQPDGSLATPVVLEAANDLLDAVAMDVDIDGDLDVVVAREQEIRWYRHDGSGGFTGAFLLVRPPRRVARVEAEDLDADGDSDLVYGNESQEHVGWFEHLSGSSFGDLQIILPTRAWPFGFALLDFDGDGLTDVVTVAGSPATLVWVRNLGGAFGAPQELPLTFFPYFRVGTLAVGDIDGDGIRDLLAGSLRIVWFSGAISPPTLRPELISPSLPGATDPITADLDGDGDLDIAVLAPGHNRLAWLPGNGDGTVGRLRVISDDTEGAIHLRCGDADGDGDPDLLALPPTGSPQIYLNDGTGTFSAPQLAAGGVSQTADVEFADFDSDGDPDIIVAALGFGGLSAYFNDGSGSFGTRQTLIPNGGAAAVLLPDLDADGDVDLVVAWADEERLFRYINEPPGTLSPRVRLGEGYFIGLASADFDGDGDLDIVASTRSHMSEVVWFANDGTGRFDPARPVGSSPFPHDILAVDLDLDGDADVYTESGAWTNDGNGRFAPDPFLCSISGEAGPSAFADLDGSEAGDLVSARYDRVWACLNRALSTATDEPPGPTDLALSLVPNPSRGFVTVRYRSVGLVSLSIYDALGREVARIGTVVGEGEVTWTAPSPGVYLVRLSTEVGRVTRRLTVIR